MKQHGFAAAWTLAAISPFTIALVSPAKAQDNSLVIWSPSKPSENAYKLRVGATVPTAKEVSGGIDFSISTSSTGRVNDPVEPARFWAELADIGGDSLKRISLGFNALTGRASTGARASRTWMVTPAVDFTTEGSVSVGYESYEGSVDALSATETARITASQYGTSLSASGTASMGASRVRTSVAVEQKVFDNVKLRAAVSRGDSDAIGSFGANFAVNW